MTYSYISFLKHFTECLDAGRMWSAHTCIFQACKLVTRRLSSEANRECHRLEHRLESRSLEEDTYHKHPLCLPTNKLINNSSSYYSSQLEVAKNLGINVAYQAPSKITRCCHLPMSKSENWEPSSDFVSFFVNNINNLTYKIAQYTAKLRV